MSRLAVLGLVYFEVVADRGDCDVQSGRERFVTSLHSRLGGAYNTASVARSLGLDVTLVYPHGDGLTDHAVTAALNDEGIPLQTWSAKGEGPMTLVLRDASDRAFVSRANLEALRALPSLSAYDAIHVAGLAEAHLAEPQLRAARASGAKVSVSASWAPDWLRKLSQGNAQGNDLRWDYLFLNSEEATYACGSVEDALNHLRTVSDHVVVTRGAEGISGFVDRAMFHTPSAYRQVSDPTGAGDSFVAGFLQARAVGATGPEAARRGAQVATDVLVKREELQK